MNGFAAWDSWMMGDMGWGGLLVTVLVLGAAAVVILTRYIFFRKPR